MTLSSEQLKQLRITILKEKGFPSGLERYVKGDDEQTIRTDVDTLSRYIKPSSPGAPMGSAEATFDRQLTLSTHIPAIPLSGDKGLNNERALRELSQKFDLMALDE